MSPLVSACRSLSVLVVDDCFDAADSLAAVLTLCGFPARAVTTTARALIETAVAPPDAVVMDLHMPGMDGWELARRLYDRAGPGERRPLLVAVTASGTNEDRRKSAAAGIDLHLVKPVEPGLLVGVLQRFADLIGRPTGTSGRRIVG